MSTGASTVKWTVVAAAGEAAATAVILFVWPSLFARLVFGAEFSDAGLTIARLAAIAMIGLALATWPTSGTTNNMVSSVRALLTYNVLAAVYLLYVGIGGQLTGIILWPAVALHAIFAIILGRAWLVTKKR